MTTELQDTDRSSEFAARVIPLMKEFGQKLESIAEQAQRIRENYNDFRGDSIKSPYLRGLYQVQMDRFSGLHKAVAGLARHVSQRVEHADLDDVTRLELTLRLAEFEEAIRTTNRILQMAQPR